MTTTTTTVRFGTTVNCMDGRAVEATINWMKRAYHLDHIDAITEPGMVGLIPTMNADDLAWLKKKLEISIKHHGSRTVTIGGHEDCAGNPVPENHHKSHIAKSVEVIKEFVAEIAPNTAIDVVGVYVSPTKSADWKVERA